MPKTAERITGACENNWCNVFDAYSVFPKLKTAERITGACENNWCNVFNPYSVIRPFSFCFGYCYWCKCRIFFRVLAIWGCMHSSFFWRNGFKTANGACFGRACAPKTNKGHFGQICHWCRPGFFFKLFTCIAMKHNQAIYVNKETFKWHVPLPVLDSRATIYKTK